MVKFWWLVTLLFFFLFFLGLLSFFFFCFCSFCLVGELFELFLYGSVLVAGGQGGETNKAEGTSSSVSV